MFFPSVARGIFHFTKMSRIFHAECRRSFLFADNCLRFPQRSTNLSSRLSSNCPLPSPATVTIGDRFFAPFPVPLNSGSSRPARVHYSLPTTGLWCLITMTVQINVMATTIEVSKRGILSLWKQLFIVFF